ncbi:hypothetical protein O6H91_Y320800 [Diphasiastrum complanatum]|nr:hypothetical protein O6H91_Y320800 [Diphasiastrum complanatum]KAJ7286699.1 hypothetical protein O6H91_Y320800 [Diphasiastrum complanatum]
MRRFRCLMFVAIAADVISALGFRDKSIYALQNMAEDGKEHHVPAGGFKNPWPSFGFAAGLKDGLSMFIWDYDRKRSRVTAEVRAQLGEPLKTNTKMLLKPPSDQIQV